MESSCVWEHNGNDTLIYSVDFSGVYTRGSSFEQAARKIPSEIRSYCQWAGLDIPEKFDVSVAQDVSIDLNVSDADSDVSFNSENLPLSLNEFRN